MTIRSRAVLFGALSLLVLSAIPATATSGGPELPYIEPVEGLPMWYFATWAVLDRGSRGPMHPPDIPIEVEPFAPTTTMSMSSGRAGGVGAGVLAGTAGLQTAVAFPATLGKMPVRPGGKALRRNLAGVQRALGY